MTAEELREIGNPETADRIDAYTAALLDENERINLTGARTPAALDLHIRDSLMLCNALRECNVTRLLDLGSGGGLPGIPLACAFPAMQVFLLDSIEKKAAALRRMVERAGLANVRVMRARAEHIAHQPEFARQFDALTARAVAPLEKLIAWSAGFLRPGGAAWFYKTPRAIEQERARAAHTAARAGLRERPERDVRYRLPGESDDRIIVCYEKHANTGHVRT